MLTHQCVHRAYDAPESEDKGDLASSLKELAQIYQFHQHYDDARLLLSKALGLEKLFLGRLHPQVAITTAELASIHQEEGDLGQATLLYKQALMIAERTVASNRLLLSSILSSLAECYRLQSLYAEARQTSKRADSLRTWSIN